MNIARLLYLGNVVVDIELDVPALPRRGGDVLARGSQLAPGGGFNVMAAAARQGLPVAYAGAHGSGPFADLARAGLAAEGIEVLQPARPDSDTGFVVAVVDDTAERTFVTSRGAEATLTAADLAGVTARPGDAAGLSGYGLVHPSNRGALRLSADGIPRLSEPAGHGRRASWRARRRSAWSTTATGSTRTGRRTPSRTRGSGRPSAAARSPATGRP